MIQNTTKKRVTGVVTDPDIKKDYIGIESDTASVVIDPATKEVKVDVKFEGILDWSGSDANKAYPATLGRDALVRADLALQSVQEEQNRAIHQEELLHEAIEDFADSIAVGDGKSLLAVKEEETRAKLAETELSEQLSLFEASLDGVNSDVAIQFEDTHLFIIETKQNLESQIRQVKDDFFDEVNQSNIAFNKRIDATDKRVDNIVESLEQDVSEQFVSIDKKFETVDLQLDQTNKNIAQFKSEVENNFIDVDNTIKNIKSTYATKVYVHEEILNSLQLSKQLVEDVDLATNHVIINGKIVDPVDGFLYLLRDSSNKGSDVYQEYTTIDGILTLIGDTSMSLEGYATEEYVNNQINAIPEVDLTPYAKKIDLPTKVSQLENDKGYLTEHQDLSGKADRIHKHVLTDITDYQEPDLTPYAKVIDIPTNVSQLNNDSNYASVDYVDTSIANIPEVDLNGKADKFHQHSILDVIDYVEPYIPTKLSELTNDAGYLTEHQSLENYATKDYVESAVQAKSNELTLYVDNRLPKKVSDLPNDAGYLTEHQSLEDYAKKEDIPDVSSFIAEIPDEYVTDSELTAKGYYDESKIITLLNNVKFIDGGTSASMVK